MTRKTDGPPRACIILTGSELTQGVTRDANGPFLASHLTTIGFEVVELRLVPDRLAELCAALEGVVASNALVLTSGGLGPTADDRTVAALAQVVGRPVVRDPQTLAGLEERARRRYGDIGGVPANFYKQAEVVEGAEVLGNPVGQAPGFAVDHCGATIVVLPGVPRELRAIFLDLVVPFVERRFILRPPRIIRAKVVGRAESVVEEGVQSLAIEPHLVEYGISARAGEALLKFVARSPAGADSIEPLVARLGALFGDDFLFLGEGLGDGSGDGTDTDHAAVVHRLLLTSGFTVATAESCTGGLVAARLTDHPGSSAYFLGSVVAYANRAKVQALGVEEELIASHGAVSRQVAVAMARRAQDRFGADFAVATTGIAGPGGGSADKPVGLVHVAVVGPHGQLDAVEMRLPGERAWVRAQAVTRTLELLRRAVLGSCERAVGDPRGRVGATGAVMRQGADDLNALLGEPRGKIAAAREQEHAQVAAIDDVLAARARLLDQVAERRVQLRRTTGDVDAMRLRAVQRRETGLDGLCRHHLVGAIRSRVHMTMPAGHVAQLAEVDLEDLQRHSRQALAPTAGRQVAVEVGREIERVENPELRSGRRQRRAPRA